MDEKLADAHEVARLAREESRLIAVSHKPSPPPRAIFKTQDREDLRCEIREQKNELSQGQANLQEQLNLQHQLIQQQQAY